MEEAFARQLHIVLVVHGFYPEHFYGTESYTRTLARRFLALGHRATVVTARFIGEPLQQHIVDEFETGGIPVLRIDRNRYPITTARDTFDLPALQPLFKDILGRLAPDVVHVCHLENHTAALPAAAAALGIPVFSTLTDFYNLCLVGSLETMDGRLCAGPSRLRDNCMACGIMIKAREEPTLWWRSLAHPKVLPVAARVAASLPFLLPPPVRDEAQAVVDRPDVFREAMRTYRAVIAPTRFLARAFEANGCPVPIDVSPFGVDIDRHAKPERSGADLRLGFIGQLVQHKGPHVLLEALRRIAPGGYSLDIWGSESLAPDFSQELRVLARGLPVTFRDTFDETEIASVLADIDVLVLPSTWYENSPLTLLKALATHTPVVVSDVEGMTEFIAEGVNGFAFRRGDADALAAVLRRFVEDRTLAGTMSLGTHYDRTENDMAVDLLRLYRRYGVS